MKATLPSLALIFFLLGASTYLQAVDGDPIGYYQSGEKKDAERDYKGALEDYTLGINSCTASMKWWLSTLHERRGRLRFVTGDLQGALSDFQDVAALPIADPGRDFGIQTANDVRIKLWIIRTKLGKKAQADTELADYLAKRTGPPSIYYNNNGHDTLYLSAFANNANLLLNRLSDADYIKTNQPDWYCLAMKHLLAGDKETALDYFRKYLAPHGDAQPEKGPDEHGLELKIPELKALTK